MSWIARLPRPLLWLLGIGIAAYVVILHVIVMLAFFAPHLVPYQGWRFELKAPEPSAYAIQRHRHIAFLDQYALPGSLAFIGASHVEGMDTALYDRPVLKYAAGGDTVRHTITHLPEYEGLERASAIILLAGFNDTTYRTAQPIADDMETMLTLLPDDVPIIMLELAPTSVAERQEVLRDVNALYRPLCAAKANCHFVETTPILGDGKGGLKPEYDRGDGVHLSGAGYQQLADAVNAALPPVESEAE